MKTISLTSRVGRLSGEALPDYGGMLARLRYDGKDIFYLDEAKVPLAPVLAGGNPVMFPFPSKTADDRYALSGKTYSMPFHGLVKYAQFGVKRADDESATLYVGPTEAQKAENYPFDYRLEVTYALRGDTAVFDAEVFNLSPSPLPHYFGWHPYFKASDRTRFFLRTQMRKYVDYRDGKTYRDANNVDVTAFTDYVCFDKEGTETVIRNPADGYRAVIRTDDAFDALVVSTLKAGSVCVEPWLGLPDSINTGKYLKWVAAHESASFHMEIEIGDCAE